MYAVYLNGITMAKIHKKRNEEKNKNIKKSIAFLDVTIR